MPEPLPLTEGVTPPMWPASLPNPQASSMTVSGPGRAQVFETLTGPTRLRVVARTAPPSYTFSCFLTQEQMQAFEAWYVDVLNNHDGEFYARWIGGSRVVAFSQGYQYEALGSGYVLSGHLVRTRIDTSACDAFINSVFGAIYRDDGKAPDTYRADLAASDVYKDDYPLSLIAANEC